MMKHNNQKQKTTLMFKPQTHKQADEEETKERKEQYKIQEM